MFVLQLAYPRIMHVALLVCAGLLVAPTASANAQSQKDYSSSRENSMYSNEDADASSLSSERNGQSNGNEGGYVSHDRWGADHLTFEGGGGFAIPTGSGKQFLNKGWNIKAGGGYKFNDRFSAMLDYDYVSMGVPTAILNQVNPQGGGATLR
jgi:long-subunit fatty acid transport protein